MYSIYIFLTRSKLCLQYIYLYTYILYTCMHDDSLILATYDGTIRLCRELIQMIYVIYNIIR